MLAHVPSFGRNLRGSPAFLAYPVPKACMHVLGTRVPRRLGVARSASSPKAAQALGCGPYPRSPDLVWPGHLHGTGCLSARAVGTGFRTVVRRLCLDPVCGWVWVLLTLPVLAGVLGGCVWARFVVLSLICQLFVVFVVGLRFRPAYGTCVVSCVFCLPPAVSVSVVRCGRACWDRVSAVPCPSWHGCWGVFLALFFVFFRFLVSVAGCPCPGPCGPCPPIPFLSGWAAGSFFFSWCVSACFGVPFPGAPLFLAWCCRFWLGGPPVPLWGSCLRCLRGRAFGCLWWCWRAVWWLWAVFAPPPPPPSVFLFWGARGLPVSPSAFPGLAHALARIQCGLPGCCWQLRSVWPCSGPMGQVGYVHVGLGAPSCRVRCVWLWVRGLGLFVSFPLCGASFNLLGGPPPLLPGAWWPRVWPAVPLCGVLVRRLSGCVVACFG